MPGVIGVSTVIGTLPHSLSTKFTESNAVLMNINEYHDGASQRNALVTSGRRSWKIAKRLDAVSLGLLSDFFDAAKSGAFYFFNPSETNPPYSSNPVNTAGRYLVRFNSDWSQTNGMSRSDCEIELIEVSAVGATDIGAPIVPDEGSTTTGPPLDTTSPYYSRIAQGWLFAEGSGSVTHESKYGYTATFDPTGVEWVNDGILGSTQSIHINGGFPIGTNPRTAVFPVNSDPAVGLEVGQFSMMNGPSSPVHPRSFSIVFWVEPSADYISTDTPPYSYPYDAALLFKTDDNLTVDEFGHYQWDPTRGFSLVLTREPAIIFTMYAPDLNWYEKPWVYPAYGSPDPSSIFGNWTQFVITTDNSLNMAGVKLYVNGLEVTPVVDGTSLSSYVIDNVGALKFGGSDESGDPHLATPLAGGAHGSVVGPSSARPLNGKLDNLVIFDGTLSAAEVADLYTHPYSPWGLTAKPTAP